MSDQNNSNWNRQPSAKSFNTNTRRETNNSSSNRSISHSSSSGSKTNQDIIIRPGDRILSKKFSEKNQHQNHQLLDALLNSFNHSVSLGSANQRSMDIRMSLVASPSRGLDHLPNLRADGNGVLNGLDLTDEKFQTEFLDWFLVRLKKHRARFKDPKIVFIYDLRDFNNNQGEEIMRLIEEQRESVKDLIRHIRKLREGIIVCNRLDQVTVLVYELSVELALEASDLLQLNSILPNLIKNIYNQINRPTLNARQEDDAQSGYLTHIQQRRSYFKSIYLFLSLLNINRTPSSDSHLNSKNYSQFLSSFEELSRPASNRPNASNCKETETDGHDPIDRRDDADDDDDDEGTILASSFKIFRCIRRSDPIKLNSTIDKYISQTSSRFDCIYKSKDDGDTVRWDLMVLLKVLKDFRNIESKRDIQDRFRKIYNNTLRLNLSEGENKDDDWYLIRILNFDNDLYLALDVYGSRTRSDDEGGENSFKGDDKKRSRVEIFENWWNEKV
ncbi:hypothetical protein BY996DRAFT_6527404 [Phakopsora pachyrhizi]|uniref:Expressed protein n=1 Tax=Phakopsora pachyrhizi TaxID=170000 RepID=A0AAV0BSM2_PHAPC|nr:hypothetical protein BY996DRAFT_6527404 [Phakopsora pachyrhizi]CAH7689662.1 expressed protein [Phakopsora pachyrhizi]